LYNDQMMFCLRYDPNLMALISHADGGMVKVAGIGVTKHHLIIVQ
jgi:hypothetical protein